MIVSLDDVRLARGKSVGVERLRGDPVIFIRQMLREQGFDLQPWQESELLRMMLRSKVEGKKKSS